MKSVGRRVHAALALALVFASAVVLALLDGEAAIRLLEEEADRPPATATS